MEDDEHVSITEEGIAEAVHILYRDGYLLDLSKTDDFSDLNVLKAACEKYVEKSVARGSQRTSQECRDALLIGFFQAWVDDQLRYLVN